MSKTGFRLQSRGEGDLKTRYRPQMFSELAPTAPLTRLKGIITNPSSQVYLFEGPPGSGKTSCARIIARGLICEATEGEKPCLKCDPCVNMERSGDFEERNVGDDRKIDDIRELTRCMHYEPRVLSRRIVVLDEVHNLLGPAQECLLKPLEEPKPRMLVFLCTTSTKNLKKTLIERAQRIAFKPLDRDTALSVIEQVIEQEKGPQPDDATKTAMYESAGGSVRLLLNNIQAYIEGGFQPGLAVEEEATDDVKDLANTLRTGEWSRVAAVLKRPTLRGMPESVRIGVECLTRTYCLNSPDLPAMGKWSLVLKHMVGTLAVDPGISQYNALVFRCMLVCRDIKHPPKKREE